MPQEHFECGKCNSSLVIDDSLKNLSIAQTNLLVNKNAESYDALEAERTKLLDPEQYIPRDRLATFREAQAGNSKPLVYRNLMESIDDTQDEDDEEDADKVTNSSTSPEIVASERGIDSYVVLESDSENQTRVEPSADSVDHAISLRINTLGKIFDILSSHSEIDHPLSQDCADLLLDNFKLKFDQTQLEKNNFLAFLRKLEEKEAQQKLGYKGDYSADIDLRLTSTVAEFARMKTIEEEKLAELKTLEEQRFSLERELHDRTAEFEELQKNGLTSLLLEGNIMKSSYNEQLGHLNQLKAAYNSSLDHLDNLRRTNVYSMLFPIAIDQSQKFGTINGLRLGYQVEWPEVNAALGQVVLLLSFLARSLTTDLGDYELVPMGSQSRIIKFSSTEENGQRVRQRSVLHVYNTNEFSLGKLFNYNKLDAPMILLLYIMTAIQSSLIERDPEVVLPYEILHKNTSIGGKSIRVTSNAEWTVACRFMLTNLKWLLAYVGNYALTPEEL